MVSLRAFLKSAIAAVAALPFLGFVKPRKYITKATLADLPGLCFESTTHSPFSLVPGKVFLRWRIECVAEHDGIDNWRGDKFWVTPVGQQQPKILFCFMPEDDGLVRLDSWRFYRPD